MSHLHIVTDSAASFSHPRVMEQYPLSILPVKLNIGGQHYREGIDLDAGEIMRLIAGQSHPPELVIPSIEEYEIVFARLSKAGKEIISLHPSREFSDSWYHGREAARQVDGNIAVIDTHNICAGQGMLVRVAGEAALAKMDFQAAVNKVRAAVERVFSTYYVEKMDYLVHENLMTESRMLLGTFLKIKPFLSIEEGKLQVTAKVRTRAGATERLMEFLTEFDKLDDATIVQHRSHITEQTRTLQDRLSDAFPGRHFPYSMYNASMAAMIGATGTGVAVLESEHSGFGDGI
ncbi:MAG: DegV family protein [Aggregatilineales bacterium]